MDKHSTTFIFENEFGAPVEIDIQEIKRLINFGLDKYIIIGNCMHPDPIVIIGSEDSLNRFFEACEDSKDFDLNMAKVGF